MVQAGAPMAGAAAAAVPNYLVKSILCTLFCCLPFGVVAIVYAAQVNGHLLAGNADAARASSEQARKWSTISFFCGLGVAILYGILMAVGMVSGTR